MLKISSSRRKYLIYRTKITLLCVMPEENGPGGDFPANLGGWKGFLSAGGGIYRSAKASLGLRYPRPGARLCSPKSPIAPFRGIAKIEDLFPAPLIPRKRSFSCGPERGIARIMAPKGQECRRLVSEGLVLNVILKKRGNLRPAFSVVFVRLISK